jgi:hypothetical protein
MRMTTDMEKAILALRNLLLVFPRAQAPGLLLRSCYAMGYDPTAPAAPEPAPALSPAPAKVVKGFGAVKQIMDALNAGKGAEDDAK